MIGKTIKGRYKERVQLAAFTWLEIKRRQG